MMSEDLCQYLKLEKFVFQFDETGDPLVEDIRSQMNVLWTRMSQSDRDYLNYR